MKPFKLCALTVAVVLSGLTAFGSEGADDVIRLQSGGIDHDVMLAFVNNNTIAYDLSADEIQRLEDQKVAPTVVVAMIDHGKQLRGEIPRPAPTEAAAVTAPDSTPAPASAPAAESAVPVDPSPTAAYAPAPEDQNISFFYESLAPHGRWFHDPNYGNVWQPNEVLVQADWRPYSNGGQWVWSDQGWYFESAAPFGWAAYHYGRWYNSPENRWCWVPGNEWAASWVDWRQADGYIGWAPLPPEARFEMGVGFSFRGHVGVDLGFGLGVNAYAFVPSASFLEVDIGRDMISRERVGNVYSSSRVVNNSYTYNDNRVVNNGIAPATIARATGQAVNRVQIEDMKVATGRAIGREQSNGNKIVAYRPKIANTTPRDPQAAIQHAATLRTERRAAATNRAATTTENRAVRREGAQQNRAYAAQSEQEAHNRLQQEKAQRVEADRAHNAQAATNRAEKTTKVKASAEERKAAVNAEQNVRREANAEKRDAGVEEARGAKASAGAQREEKSQAVRNDAQENRATTGAEQDVRREAVAEKRDARVQDSSEKAPERKASAEPQREARQPAREENRDERERK